jgi:hypothetical protein
VCGRYIGAACLCDLASFKHIPYSAAVNNYRPIATTSVSTNKGIIFVLPYYSSQVKRKASAISNFDARLAGIIDANTAVTIARAQVNQNKPKFSSHRIKAR